MNTQGIAAWIVTNLLPLAVLGIGFMVIMGARKGNWGKEMSTVALMIIGVMVIAGAGSIYAFGDELAGIVFNPAPPADGPTP